MKPLPLQSVFAARLMAAAAQLSANRILHAISWTAIPHLLSQVIRLGGSLVLTRLLAPDLFGIAAITVTIQVTLALLSDIGLRTTVIQSRNGDDPNFLNTAWTLQIIRGWLIWAIGLLIAAGLWIAGDLQYLSRDTTWGAAELPAAIAATMFGAVLAGFQSTNHISANRHLDLKKIALIEVIAQLGALGWMIVWSLLSPTIWALVTGGLLNTLIVTILSHTWLPGIKNKIAWNKAHAAELYTFGLWILYSSTCFVLSANLDRAILGSVIPPFELGLYAIALSLATLPEAVGSRIFYSIFLPALSEIARTRPQDFQAAYWRFRLPSDIAFIGIAGFIFAAGADVIDLLYDTRYEHAGQFLQILSFSLLFSRYGSSNFAYIALGQPKLPAHINLTKLIAIATLLPFAHHHYGLTGALYVIACHGACTLPLTYVYNRRYGLLDLKGEFVVLAAWPVGYLLGIIAGAVI